jgi:hypothetical protein
LRIWLEGGQVDPESLTRRYLGRLVKAASPRCGEVWSDEQLVWMRSAVRALALRCGQSLPLTLGCMSHHASALLLSDSMFRGQKPVRQSGIHLVTLAMSGERVDDLLQRVE